MSKEILRSCRRTWLNTLFLFHTNIRRYYSVKSHHFTEEMTRSIRDTERKNQLLQVPRARCTGQFSMLYEPFQNIILVLYYFLRQMLFIYATKFIF